MNAIFTPTNLVTNEAGGTAYAMTDKLALLQLATTGCFNNTYYATATDQLTNLKALADKCTTTWVAQVAIYARTNGYMKDMPAYLVAYLASRKEKDIFNYTFDKVIDNIGMLRNFVQIIRSGTTGRKSLGTVPKKAIARLLNRLSANQIFYQCAGTTPSIQDVIKLAHPKPQDTEHDALFAYLLDKEYLFSNLPSDVRAFEDFKAKRSTTIPNVDFRRLTALDLTKDQWTSIGYKMTWNQLRMNLNTLARHGCFEDNKFIGAMIDKLHDYESIAKLKVFPFAILNALNSLENVPASVKNALGDCLDRTYLNAPQLKGKTLILVDSSGSMNSAITGSRGTATTTMTCVQAAGYFAASLLKANPDSVTIIPFDTSVHPVQTSARNSVETITKALRCGGGGTSISCGIQYALRSAEWQNILIISDNESWFDRVDIYNASRQTETTRLWNQYKTKVPNARLVCWDIQPYTTTQVKNDNSILNVGGFTESVYNLVGGWFNNDQQTWADAVSAIPVR